MATTTEKNRGRIETRTVTTTAICLDTLNWPGAGQLIRLERKTITALDCRSSVVYAVTSLSREQADASRLLSLLRGRWRIENSVFHVLDVVFGEDASRVRTKQSPSVLAAVRAAALNFLRKLKLPVAATLREHAV
jgi:predicted transposase YbfD/YdcC